MGLSMTGESGELRRGRAVVARLSSWRKDQARVTFTTSYVNQFAAGQGPPTSIVLDVGRVRRTYPVTAGTLEAGAVKVDLANTTTETTV